jgi:hypothetical protein
MGAVAGRYTLPWKSAMISVIGAISVAGSSDPLLVLSAVFMVEGIMATILVASEAEYGAPRIGPIFVFPDASVV